MKNPDADAFSADAGDRRWIAGTPAGPRVIADVEVGPGDESDIARLRAMLAAVGLPAADADAMLPDGLLIARREGRVAGAVGLQTVMPDGLLRSLVVEPGDRGRGLGAALVRALERLAAERGVVRLYLLTTTAADFFKRLGYETVARDSVPPGIAATAEFRTLCPASAVCLSRKPGG